MKKTKKIIIVALIIITLIAVPIGAYLYYDLFVPDEISDEYRQTWQTDDGSLILVTDNKKGFLTHNYYLFNGELSNDKNSVDVGIDFTHVCMAYTDSNYFDSETASNNLLFEGDYSYNFITAELIIKVTNTTKKYDDMFSYKEFKLHKV